MKQSAAEVAHEPSLVEVLGLPAASFALFVLLLAICRVNYWEVVRKSLDNASYIDTAAAMLARSLSRASPKYFWGLSYVLAAISGIFRIPLPTALVLVSAAASLLSSLLVKELYGARVAAFFALVCYPWVYLSVLGGSEPLCVALVLGAFLAARREKWLLAALLASLATTVRPVGVFVLAGLVADSLLRRDLRRCVLIAMVGLVIGALYVMPLVIAFGSPLVHFYEYRDNWQGHAVPVTFPLVALFRSLAWSARWSWSFPIEILWVLAMFAAAGRMAFSKDFREFAWRHAAEAAFLAFYLLFIFSYRYESTVLCLPRFMIPAAPLVLVVLGPWLPRSRAVRWSLAALNAVLATFATIGFRALFPRLFG